MYFITYYSATDMDLTASEKRFRQLILWLYFWDELSCLLSPAVDKPKYIPNTEYHDYSVYAKLQELCCNTLLQNQMTIQGPINEVQCHRTLQQNQNMGTVAHPTIIKCRLKGGWICRLHIAVYINHLQPKNQLTDSIMSELCFPDSSPCVTQSHTHTLCIFHLSYCRQHCRTPQNSPTQISAEHMAQTSTFAIQNVLNVK